MNTTRLSNIKLHETNRNLLKQARLNYSSQVFTNVEKLHFPQEIFMKMNSYDL